MRGRLAAVEHLVRGQIERLEELDHGRALRDVAIPAEVRHEDRANELPGPRLVRVRGRDPQRQRREARKRRRPLPRQPELRGEPFHVAPHVLAAPRVQIEMRVVPALQREDRPERERLPRQFHAGVAAHRLDTHRRDVRVRAREVEPELERIHVSFNLRRDHKR